MSSCRECGEQIEETCKACPHCNSNIENLKPFSLERNKIILKKWRLPVSIVLTTIFFVLGTQSYMGYKNFNPEEHFVHKEHNGTKEFEFNASDEIQYFGVYVKIDRTSVKDYDDCERMEPLDIRMYRIGSIPLDGWYGTEWHHDCRTSYHTDEYAYVGYVDLTTGQTGAYTLESNFDTILLVDHNIIPKVWDFVIYSFLALIGLVVTIVSPNYTSNTVNDDTDNMEHNNAKNNVVNESGKTKVDNTRQRVPTNYKKVDFWGPNKPRKK